MRLSTTKRSVVMLKCPEVYRTTNWYGPDYPMTKPDFPAGCIPGPSAFVDALISFVGCFGLRLLFFFLCVVDGEIICRKLFSNPLVIALTTGTKRLRSTKNRRRGEAGGMAMPPFTGSTYISDSSTNARSGLIFGFRLSFGNFRFLADHDGSMTNRPFTGSTSS
jgi:hypothetical protein